MGLSKQDPAAKGLLTWNAGKQVGAKTSAQNEAGSEVFAVRIFNFADDGLWGKLSALGIIMILLSTGLVLIATYAGNRFKCE